LIRRPSIRRQAPESVLVVRLPTNLADRPGFKHIRTIERRRSSVAASSRRGACMRGWSERLVVAAAFACIAAAPASAADVRPELVGKTIVVSWSESDREMDISSGHQYPYTVRSEARFVFGADGQIATRYVRAIDGRAPFSAAQTFDADGSLLTGPTSRVYKIVKVEFQDRNFAASLVWGNHGAQQIRIAVGLGASACTGEFLQGTDHTGNTDYASPFDGRMKRSMSRQVSGVRCQIANGDANKG
jgi:hypothetical protein